MRAKCPDNRSGGQDNKVKILRALTRHGATLSLDPHQLGFASVCSRKRKLAMDAGRSERDPRPHPLAKAELVDDATEAH
jgi:hypothetical protein